MRTVTVTTDDFLARVRTNRDNHRGVKRWSVMVCLLAISLATLYRQVENQRAV